MVACALILIVGATSKDAHPAVIAYVQTDHNKWQQHGILEKQDTKVISSVKVLYIVLRVLCVDQGSAISMVKLIFVQVPTVFSSVDFFYGLL